MYGVKQKLKRKFKVRTSWVNFGAFCVSVEEYHLEPYLWVFSKWKLHKIYEYASWEDFMSIMWKKHMLRGETMWEIDTKI